MTQPDDDLLARAVSLLEAGELVAFPTETVYGLGADASNPAAVARIFAAKGRPADHPLIVHLGSVAEVATWAREFPPYARRLADAFWPGPLTLVLPRTGAVCAAVTGGQDTVALRVPAHPLARELLRRFGRGVAAPSANRYGRISPTRAEHVREELGDSVALVLDGGDCEVGLESTIVGCDGPGPTLLRPGRITRAQIEQHAGPLRMPGAAAPRVPGALRSHYAPATPLELATAAAIEQRCRTGEADRLAVLALRPRPADCRAAVWYTAPADPADYGRRLYAALRALDRGGAAQILVEAVPQGEPWDAVRDRLQRAAAGELQDET